MNINDLVAQRWTECGPVKDSQAGEVFYKVTIAELPGFLVTGSTPYEVISNVRSKLRVFLTHRVEEGLDVPLPAGKREVA